MLEERFWDSEFARFVRSYGVDLMAQRLSIKPSAIYHWIRGSTAPRPVHAFVVQHLARQRGVMLTMDAIYGHFLSMRAPEIPSEPIPVPAAARPAMRMNIRDWK